MTKEHSHSRKQWQWHTVSTKKPNQRICWWVGGTETGRRGTETNERTTKKFSKLWNGVQIQKFTLNRFSPFRRHPPPPIPLSFRRLPGEWQHNTLSITLLCLFRSAFVGERFDLWMRGRWWWWCKETSISILLLWFSYCTFRLHFQFIYNAQPVVSCYRRNVQSIASIELGNASKLDN